jgi:hypothetical protein
MFESTESDEYQDESGSERLTEDASHAGGGIGGQGGEGEGAAAGTAEIGEEGDVGKTQMDAPDDETGVPDQPDRTD